MNVPIHGATGQILPIWTECNGIYRIPETENNVLIKMLKMLYARTLMISKF